MFLHILTKIYREHCGENEQAFGSLYLFLFVHMVLLGQNRF